MIECLEMRRVMGWLLSLWVGLCSVQVGAATLQASVDRNEVLLDESVRFSLRYDGGQSGQPDFSPLEKDFDILSRSQSSQLRLINGKRESWVQWDLTLLAKRAGTLIVPSIDYQGARSQPVTIRVEKRSSAGGGASASAGRERDYFVELELDKQRLRVQEQLLLKVRLLSSVSLTNLQGGELSVPTAKVVLLGDKRYEQIRKGVRYGVYEVSYALFPQESGELVIPGVAFLAERGAVRSLFGSQRGQLVRLQSEPQRVKVLPRAAGFSVDRWLPASAASLTQQWAPDALKVRVGEPITRTLRLRAEGVGQAQLPPLPIPEMAGVKLYREPAQTDEQQTETGLVAERIERIGMVASQEGSLVLPAVRLRWWDTGTDQARELVLPETVIEVLPAEVAVTPTAPSAPSVGASAPSPTVATVPMAGNGDSQLRRWLLLSNGLWASVCLLLGWLWWRSRSTGPRTRADSREPGSDRIDEAQALAALEAACRGNDLETLRQALASWAQVRWPDEPALTMAEIGRRLGQETLIHRLQTLDRALYGPASAVTGADLESGALLDAVKAQHRARRSSNTRRSALPELYGESR